MAQHYVIVVEPGTLALIRRGMGLLPYDQVAGALTDVMRQAVEQDVKAKEQAGTTPPE